MSPAPSLPAGYRVCRYDTVTSTNDEARRLALDGAADGTLVWAAAQSEGRGRRGRHWVSPPGNLYVSLLLRPACLAATAAQLSFVASLALGDALAPLVARASGQTVELACKWPNDVLANRRKLAGILLESATGTGDGLSFVIIGIGVNLVSAPQGVEFPATSLAELGVAGVTPDAVLAGLVGAFAGWRQRWEGEGFAAVRTAWLARATGLGELVRVRLPDATLHGRFGDLDGDGALLLDGAGGRRRITAGEVFPAGAG